LTLTFDDYTDDQLVEIFTKITSNSDFTPGRRDRTTPAADPDAHPARHRIRQRSLSSETSSRPQSFGRHGGCATSGTYVTQLRELPPAIWGPGPAPFGRTAAVRRHQLRRQTADAEPEPIVGGQFAQLRNGRFRDRRAAAMPAERLGLEEGFDEASVAESVSRGSVRICRRRCSVSRPGEIRVDVILVKISTSWSSV